MSTISNDSTIVVTGSVETVQSQQPTGVLFEIDNGGTLILNDASLDPTSTIVAGIAGSSATLGVEGPVTVSGSILADASAAALAIGILGGTLLSTGPIDVSNGGSLGIYGVGGGSFWLDESQMAINQGNVVVDAAMASGGGMGFVTLESNATLEFGGNVTQTANVGFAGPNDVVTLDDPLTFQFGSIDGFATGDTVDLRNVALASIGSITYDYQNNGPNIPLLTIFGTNGATLFSSTFDLNNSNINTGQFTISSVAPGTLTADGFDLVSDGSGGTMIELPGPSTWWFNGSGFTLVSGQGNSNESPNSGDTVIATAGSFALPLDATLNANTLFVSNATLGFGGDSGISPSNPTLDDQTVIQTNLTNLPSPYGSSAAGTAVLNFAGAFYNQGTILANGPAGSSLTLNFEPYVTNSVTNSVTNYTTVAGTGVNEGQIEVTAGNSMTLNVGAGAEFFDISGINVTGGTVVPGGPVVGAYLDINVQAGGFWAPIDSVVVIKGDGTVETNATYASSMYGVPPTYAFADSTTGNTLKIDNIGSFGGMILGFAAGDTIDLGQNLGSLTPSFNSLTGVLTLYNSGGTPEAALRFISGSFTTSSFTVGTLVPGGDTVLTTNGPGFAMPIASGAWQTGSIWAAGTMPASSATELIGAGKGTVDLTTGATAVATAGLVMAGNGADLQITSNTSVGPNPIEQYNGTIEVNGGHTLVATAINQTGGTLLVDASGTLDLAGQTVDSLSDVGGTIASEGSNWAVMESGGTLTDYGILNAGSAGVFVGMDGGGTPAQIAETGSVAVVNVGSTELMSDPSSYGALTLDGTVTWTDQSGMIVGVNDQVGNFDTSSPLSPQGSASLLVENGATLNDTQYAQIASDPDSQGSATVQNGGVWNIGSPGLGVGYAGSGTLSVLNGGSVNAAAISIGQESGGQGSVVVSGSGSTLAASEVFVGGSGSGYLDVDSGGVVAASTELYVDGSAGTLTVGSGRVNAGTLDLSNVSASGGVATIGTGGTVSVDQEVQNAGVLLTMAGGTLAATGSVANSGVISGYGVISGTIDNGTGTIVATGGTLDLTGTFTNNPNGTIDIASDGVLELGADPGTGQTIAFAGGTEMILLSPNLDTGFNAALTGLAAGDGIEFGSGVTAISAALVNDNTIAVDFTASGTSGVFDFNNVSVSVGAGSVGFTTGTDGSTGLSYIQMTGTTANSTSFSNDSTYVITSGTVVQNQTLSGVDFQLDGGTLTLENTSSAPSAMSLDSASTIVAGVSGSSTGLTIQGPVTVNGPITADASGGTLTIGLDGTLLSTGSIYVSNGDTMVLAAIAGEAFWNNQSEMSVNQGSVLVEVPTQAGGADYAALENDATIEFTGGSTQNANIGFFGTNDLAKLDDPESFQLSNINGFNQADTVDIGQACVGSVAYQIETVGTTPQPVLTILGTNGGTILSTVFKLDNQGSNWGTFAVSTVDGTLTADGFDFITATNGDTLIELAGTSTSSAPSTWEFIGSGSTNVSGFNLVSGPGNTGDMPNSGDSVIAPSGTIMPPTLPLDATLNANTVYLGNAAMDFTGDSMIGPNDPTLDDQTIIETSLPSGYGSGGAGTTVINADGRFYNSGTILADGPTGSSLILNIQTYVGTLPAVTNGVTVWNIGTISPGTGVNEGQIEVTAGNSMTLNVGAGAEFFDISGIDVTGGTVVSGGPVVGAYLDINVQPGGLWAPIDSVVVIKGDGTVETNATYASSMYGVPPTYAFADSTTGNTLKIDNIGSFGGMILGFAAGDTIDLGQNLGSLTPSFNSLTGVLTLDNSGGTPEAALRFISGSFTTSSFTVGTLVPGGDTVLTTSGPGFAMPIASGAWQTGSIWAAGTMPASSATELIGAGGGTIDLNTGTTAVSTAGLVIAGQTSDLLQITSNTSIGPTNPLEAYGGAIEVTGGHTLTAPAINQTGGNVLIDPSGTLILTGETGVSLSDAGGTIASTGSNWALMESGGTLTDSGILNAGSAGVFVGMDGGGTPAQILETGSGAVANVGSTELMSDPSSYGALALNGTVTWNDQTFMLVGYNDQVSNFDTASPLGAASLVVEGGATLNDAQYAQIAASIDSEGDATVQGGTWNIGSVVSGTLGLGVGAYGSGTLSVLSGGTVNVGTNGFSAGGAAGASGTITVSGAGARIKSSGTGASIGKSGQGVLDVLNGGTVNLNGTGGITAGNSAGSSGTIAVGGITVGGTGNASAIVFAGTAGGLTAGNLGLGTVDVSSGGTILMNGTGGIAAGKSAGATGLILVDGTGASIYEGTAGNGAGIGQQGTGTLQVLGGGSVTIAATGTTAGLGIGQQAGGQGTVLVSDTGSTLAMLDAAAAVTVGGGGSGFLDVNSGGLLNDLGALNIGGGSTTSTGQVTADSGTILVAKNVTIGSAGSGTVTVGGGNALLNAGGSLSLGTSTPSGVGSNGTLYVNTGGTVDAGVIVVGSTAGVSGFTVQSGGTLTTTTLGGNDNIGATNGVASADINGGVWNANQFIGVGNGGTGTLTVANNGQINDQGYEIELGSVAGLGTLNVAAGTVSAGNLNFFMSFGSSVVAVATIGQGGTVVVGQESQGGGDLLSMAGGTLEATGTVSNSGLISGYGVISGTISNAGGTFVATGGTLDLAGTFTSAFGGTIDIASGGVLELASDPGFNQTVAFAGGTEMLLTKPNPATGFNATLTGLAVGDRIEFGGSNVALTSASVVNGNTIAVNYNNNGTSGVFDLNNVSFGSGGSESLTFTTGTDTSTGLNYIQVAGAAVTSEQWIGGSGNFDDPTQWSGAIVPTSTMTATIDVAGAPTVTHASGTDTVAGLYNIAGDLEISGGTLHTGTLANTSTIDVTGGLLATDQITDYGTLTVNGGVVTQSADSEFQISNNGTAASGTLNVLNGTLVNDGGFWINGSVNGVVNIGAGGTLISGNMPDNQFADLDAQGTGVAVINVDGGVWDSNVYANIGDQNGTGTLNVTAGGVANFGTFNVTLGQGNGSGTLTVGGRGATLDAGEINVGVPGLYANGYGTLNINAGGTVNVGDLSVGSTATTNCGTIVMAGGTLDTTSGATVDGQLSGAGTVLGGMDNNGTVIAALTEETSAANDGGGIPAGDGGVITVDNSVDYAGLLSIQGDISGTGTFEIGNLATLELGTVAAGPTIAFSGQSELGFAATTSGAFNVAIVGLDTGDIIEAPSGIVITGATVVNGNTIAVSIAGSSNTFDFTNVSFATAPVGGLSTGYDAVTGDYYVEVAAAQPVTISGTQAGQNVISGGAIPLFAGVTINDPNIGQTDTVSVAMSSTSNGTLDPTSLGIGSYNASTGVYTVTGSAAAVTTAVDGLVFDPSGAGDTSFTITDTDTAEQTASDSTTSVIAASGPQVVNGTSGSYVYTDYPIATASQTIQQYSGSDGTGTLVTDIVDNTNGSSYLFAYNPTAGVSQTTDKYSSFDSSNGAPTGELQSAVVNYIDGQTMVHAYFYPTGSINAVTETSEMWSSTDPTDGSAAGTPISDVADYSDGTVLVYAYQNSIDPLPSGVAQTTTKWSATNPADGSPSLDAYKISAVVDNTDGTAIVYAYQDPSGTALPSGETQTAAYYSSYIAASGAPPPGLTPTAISVDYTAGLYAYESSITAYDSSGDPTSTTYYTGLDASGSVVSSTTYALLPVTDGSAGDSGAVSITGSSQVVDPGFGSNTIQFLSGASDDTLVLHTGGTDTVSGFSPSAGDMLDLRSLFSESGIDLSSAVANLSAYINVTAAGSDAAVLFDPTGQGGGSAVATLTDDASLVPLLKAGSAFVM